MKYFICLFLLYLLMAFSASNEIKAQSATKNDSVKEELFINYDIPPQFPGGEMELLNFIKKNLKYPEKAILKEIEGRVYVKFKITKTGEITDIKVLRGIDEECDKEAVRIIKMMPKWKPGGVLGHCYPCEVWYTIPIRFRLSDLDKE